MASDQYQADPGRGTEAHGPAEAVAAALRGNDPVIEVAGLRVAEGAGAMPVIQGRVGSEQDRQWVLSLARRTLGRDVHDALQVDESLSSGAPAGVVSGFEDEGGTDPEVDWTQGAGAGRGRPSVPGEEDEHLGEPRPAREYVAPGLEEEARNDPGRAAGRPEV
jgi:hypothetical protein